MMARTKNYEQVKAAFRNEAKSTGPLKSESDIQLSEDDFQCLVFRTSLQNIKDVERISSVLDNLEGITHWHVDLDDWEKVLRIECNGLSAITVMDTLSDQGVIAEELPA